MDDDDNILEIANSVARLRAFERRERRWRAEAVEREAMRRVHKFAEARGQTKLFNELLAFEDATEEQMVEAIACAANDGGKRPAQ